MKSAFGAWAVRNVMATTALVVALAGRRMRQTQRHRQRPGQRVDLSNSAGTSGKLLGQPRDRVFEVAG
jgi:hypothetical protein